MSSSCNRCSKKRPKKRPSPSSLPSETRDWAALPHDVLLEVFLRLDARDIMMSVEVVCKAWRRAAVEEPTLWRRVDMTAVLILESIDTGIAVRGAVDRSGGLLEAFTGPCWDYESLLYISAGAPSLKSLHLSYGYGADDEMLMMAIEKFPVLEHLDISPPFHHITSSDKLFVSVCKACPLLKNLKIRFTLPPGFDFREAQLMELYEEHIYETPMMRELRSIEVFNYVIGSEHLTAILDNCPLLESLNITGYNVEGKMDAQLREKCARLKNLTLPSGFYSSEEEDSGLSDSSEEDSGHSDSGEDDSGHSDSSEDDGTFFM